MVLLQWVVLEPQGPGNLAAVRFSCLVRVRSLRIFPTGARPFELQQDILAVTEPKSLYLDVYFNAHPVVTDGKNKPKASNALVPTSIAYQGGQVEFVIDPVNAEFATRLMIVRGKFEKLSLAIYGDIVSETTGPPEHYSPKQLPQFSYSSLSPALDPANNLNPTSLAESLLRSIPASEKVALPLIVRLMFCLKPSNEDWEEENFPHLYSVLDDGFEDLNLEKAVDMTSRPVDDSVDETILKDFAEKLGDSVDEYNDDEAYFLAKLLSQCAPQHPSLVRFILENIDLSRMYTEPNLDRPTLLYLLDAAASLDVSRQLNSEQTLRTILHIRDSPAHEDGARRAAARLYNRIKGWEGLEDSLLSEQAPFGIAALHIKEIAAEEHSFGIWLENMITNNEILERLPEAPSIHGLPHPPAMWQMIQAASHDEFIAFLRATIGVASVVAVYAWADSLLVETCRERALAILRLWQNVRGYKEIVNHFMLMRQMTYRLESILPLDDDLPSQAGIDAEHILKALAMQPSSMLRPDFVKVMQNLQVPLNYITDVEVMELKRASGLSKEGLPGAVRLLTEPPDRLDATQRRLDLRIAVTIVLDVLQKHMDGEKELLETTWDEGVNGLSVHLIRHLTKLRSDLRPHFGLAVPPHKTQSELASVFEACNDLLKLLARLMPSYPAPSRDITTLTEAVAEIFIYTDSADMIYAQESSVCMAAQSVRQNCTGILAALVAPPSPDAQTCAAAKTVIKTLLSCAASPEGHDASHHMIQIFWLLDHVLPFTGPTNGSIDREDGRTTWIRQVLPSILPDLRIFYSLQELDNKLHIIRRFKDIDQGCIGVAEWLLLEEHQLLQKAVASVRTASTDSPAQYVAFWKVTNSANVLSALVQSTSNTSDWARNTLLEDESSKLLELCLAELLHTDVYFDSIGTLAVELISHVTKVDRGLQTTILSTLIRGTRCGRFNVVTSLLQLIGESEGYLFDENATQEFGEALDRIAEAVQDGKSLSVDFAESVFKMLEKVTPMNRSSGIFVLRGLTKDSFEKLAQWLTDTLPVAQKTELEALRLRWSVTGEPRAHPILIPADYSIELSLDSWETLLSPPVPMPSTPKRRSPVQSAEMIGMITVSPPNALLRSPEVKGLTKTYSKNDFRELRQQSSTRQNTSRLPSRHVDDFEQGPSSIAPLNLGISSSAPTPLSFPGVLPHRPLPIDPSLPMNPMYYQQ